MKKSLLLSIALVIATSATVFGQRKVVIEQFTNSGCPPCGSVTPQVAQFANANPSNVIMISYHTSFPYLDSMYYENPIESDQRVSFYGIPSVPFSKVDGNYFSGYLVPTINTTIPQRALIAPRYSVAINNLTLSGSQLSGKVIFTSSDMMNQGETLNARIAIVEKRVLKSAYLASPGANTETEYPWVVRKMIPDATGISLSNTAIGGIDSSSFVWNILNAKDLSEINLVAFVQNMTTKEIYQAEISTPLSPTGVFSNSKANDKLFTLKSNLINADLKLNFNANKELKQLEIFNALGSKIYSENLNINEVEKNISMINFPNGSYIVNVISNDNRTSAVRFVLNK